MTWQPLPPAALRPAHPPAPSASQADAAAAMAPQASTAPASALPSLPARPPGRPASLVPGLAALPGNLRPPRQPVRGSLLNRAPAGLPIALNEAIFKALATGQLSETVLPTGILRRQGKVRTAQGDDYHVTVHAQRDPVQHTLSIVAVQAKPWAQAGAMSQTWGQLTVAPPASVPAANFAAAPADAAAPALPPVLASSSGPVRRAHGAQTLRFTPYGSRPVVAEAGGPARTAGTPASETKPAQASREQLNSAHREVLRSVEATTLHKDLLVIVKFLHFLEANELSFSSLAHDAAAPLSPPLLANAVNDALASGFASHLRAAIDRSFGLLLSTPGGQIRRRPVLEEHQGIVDMLLAMFPSDQSPPSSKIEFWEVRRA